MLTLQLAGLVRMPLRVDRPTVQTATACSRVTPQLARDRGRRPLQVTRDVSHAMTLGAQQSELLAFRKENVSIAETLWTLVDEPVVNWDWD